MDVKDWSFLATDCWIKQFWIDNANAGLDIHDPIPNLQLLSMGDQYINVLAKQLEYTQAERSGINQCRLYFNITSVAELCCGDGSKIQKHFLRQPLGQPSPLSDKWPKQRQPTRKEWMAWRKLLEALGIGDEPVFGNLGSWCRDIHHQHHQLDLLKTRLRVLYKREENGWHKWIQRTDNKTKKQKNKDLTFAKTQTSGIPPANCTPVTSHLCNNHATISGPRNMIEALPIPLTFQEYISGLPHHKKWSMHQIDSLDDAWFLAQNLAESKLAAVSDGSLKDGIASAAWIITNRPFQFPSSDKVSITGGSIIPGHPSIQDSTQAELGGIHGILIHDASHV